METDPATCEDCGSTDDVKPFGWDNSMLCAKHRAQAELNTEATIEFMQNRNKKGE
jgi:hypothetical protein